MAPPTGGADVSVLPLGFSRGERVRFWRAGLPPYAGDPHFVTPLLADCLARWDPRGAFFEHAEVAHFVAVRGGRDVGRIAAATDAVQDRVHGDRTGLFGWFETEPAPETAAALLRAAEDWLRARGRDRARGPLSYTTNGISGLLVRDDRPGPPVVDMAYNPPWYADRIEAAGYAKAKDLLAFRVDRDPAREERLTRITDRVLSRGRYRLRPIRADRKGFDADVEIVQRIYNGAWEKNWGFVPLTAAEIREQAEAFRPLLVPDLVLFAERDGEAVGFALTLPDVNVALARIRGRLWPWSLVTFLLALRRVRTARVLTLGVLPEHRRTGLDAVLVMETVRRAATRGILSGECSWVLEDNRPMIEAIRSIGGTAYRAYRVYEKPLAPPGP